VADHVTAALPCAVIGAGRMGAAMVGRIVAAGHPTTVWNRTQAKAAEVATHAGCAVAATPGEAAADAAVVVVSLSDDAAVRAAYLGTDGLVAGLRPGTVVADTSTVDPRTLVDLAVQVQARGAALVDTPVSGSVATVEAGQLLVMAGGQADALEQARPVLESFSRRVVHLGPLGAGATMKLAVNAMVHALNAALSEALVLAEKAGVERTLAYEVIASSAVAAPFVAYKRQAFEHPDQAAVAFSLALVAKDLDLAARLAERVGASMPQLAANRALVQRAIDAGLGEADLSALAMYLREPDGDLSAGS
jgi:3-hydroxyisobutyrate dehydrogenase-like beta-hydroxyacid dehydrogenase